jgi:hypothetical protein
MSSSTEYPADHRSKGAARDADVAVNADFVVGLEQTQYARAVAALADLLAEHARGRLTIGSGRGGLVAPPEKGTP